MNLVVMSGNFNKEFYNETILSDGTVLGKFMLSYIAYFDKDKKPVYGKILCKCFNRVCEAISKLDAKRHNVIVEGRIGYEEFDKMDGDKVKRNYIMVSKIKIMK